MSGAGPPRESDARGDLAVLLAAVATRLRRVVTAQVSPTELCNTVLDCVRALDQLAGAYASKTTAATVCATEQTAAATPASVDAANAASVHRASQQNQRPPADDGP